MSLDPVDVESIEQWVTAGVPDDRRTRDFICDQVLPKLWADRNEWVTAATELGYGSQS